MASKNQVVLAGKVSKVRDAKYTPSGVCVREVLLAVPQTPLEKPSIGYFEIVFTGDFAQQGLDGIKIGDSIEVSGSLWSRSYKNREGTSLNETKVMADSLKQLAEGQRK